MMVFLIVPFAIGSRNTFVSFKETESLS
jgi:hypothetical protein